QRRNMRLVAGRMVGGHVAHDFQREVAARRRIALHPDDLDGHEEALVALGVVAREAPLGVPADSVVGAHAALALAVEARGADLEPDAGRALQAGPDAEVAEGRR